jgi:hypothetical protein
MLPLGLLLPWPAVVLQHPQVLLHGVGSVVPEPMVPPARLAALDAGGVGSAGWLGAAGSAGWLGAAGVAAVAVALLTVLARPRRAALPGLGLALVGLGVAVMVNTVTAVPLAGGEPRPGWPGPALLVAACGLLWAAFAALAVQPPSALAAEPPTALAAGKPRTVLAAGVATAAGLVVAALAAGASLAVGPLTVGSLTVGSPDGALSGGGGALLRERPRLAPPVQAEASADQTGVLVVGAPGDPVRCAVARLPAFGDDDLVPVRTRPARMARWAAAFRSGRPGSARSAVLEAAASGVEFVVLSDRPAADLLTASAGDLVAAVPPTSDGRPVLRLVPLSAPVVVLPPQLAGKARTGGAPPDDYAAADVVPVPAAPPNVGAEVSAGTQGRVLVVAAEDEPGWRVTVDGERSEVSRAWGHLVAVVLPADRAEVRIERSGTTRTLLLLAQLAVALFTAIAAIPAGRRS